MGPKMFVAGVTKYNRPPKSIAPRRMSRRRKVRPRHKIRPRQRNRIAFVL